MHVNGTVARIDLDRPLAPAGIVTLDLAFAFQAPEMGTFRTVHGEVGEGRIYEIAQWYPRMAVYDDVRGWNTDQYLGNGEFYLEYGDFDVFITVPRSFIVAAPGTLVNEAEVLTPAQQARLAAARRSDSTIAIIEKAEAGEPSSRPPSTGEAPGPLRLTSAGMRSRGTEYWRSPSTRRLHPRAGRGRAGHRIPLGHTPQRWCGSPSNTTPRSGSAIPIPPRSTCTAPRARWSTPCCASAARARASGISQP